MRYEDIQSYMGLARDAAARSKAKRLQVGAVIVNPDGVMAFGYNGTPAGWDNACEENDVTKPEVLHAETNALFKFVQSGISTKGSTMFLTHSPCLECAKVLYLAGVSRVVYEGHYRSAAGTEFLGRVGVDTVHYK